MRYRRTDIVRKVFSRVRNGYDESEVDVFLDELAEDADVCLAEIARLKEQNAQLIAHSRKLEQLLETAKEQKRTQEDMRLEIDAERRELLERTRLQARSMVDEARRQARAIVDDAYREADQMRANARVLPREYLEQEPTADPPAFRMRGSFLPPPQAGGDVPAAQMDGRTNGGEEQPAPVRLEVSERIPRNPEPAAPAPAEEGRGGRSAAHETPAGGAAAQEGPRIRPAGQHSLPGLQILRPRHVNWKPVEGSLSRRPQSPAAAALPNGARQVSPEDKKFSLTPPEEPILEVPDLPWREEEGIYPSTDWLRNPESRYDSLDKDD